METAWREERIAPPRRAAATPPGTSRRRRARGSTGFGARRHRDERAKPPARPHVLHPASPTRRRPRDAWSRSRTRPPHQRPSSATPRGPRGALSRAPRYARSRAPIRGLNRAHPSLLRPCVARRINVTFAGPLRGGSGRATRRPSIEAHARSFYTQDDDSRRSSRTRARGERISRPSPRVAFGSRSAPPHPPVPPPPMTVPSSTRCIIHAVVAVSCASAGAAFSSPSAAPTAFFLASLPAPTENAPGLIATVLVVLFVL